MLSVLKAEAVLCICKQINIERYVDHAYTRLHPQEAARVQIWLFQTIR